MLNDRFYAKTWMLWAQFLMCIMFGAFATTTGIMFWTGAIKDAHDEPRPQIGLPLTSSGILLIMFALLVARKVMNLTRPVIRCRREGIEVSLAFARSFEKVSSLPGHAQPARAFFGFRKARSQFVQTSWTNFIGATDGGLPMAQNLQLTGLFIDDRSIPVAQSIMFEQA